MSQRITCRCQTANLNENVIQKALVDLQKMFPRANFLVENGEIKAQWDSDNRYKEDNINQAIQERLNYYQGQHLRERKAKLVRLARRLGQVDKITISRNSAGHGLTKIKISR